MAEKRGLILGALIVTAAGAAVVGWRVGRTQYAKELKPMSNQDREMSINRERLENRIYNVPLISGIAMTSGGIILSLKGTDVV